MIDIRLLRDEATREDATKALEKRGVASKKINDLMISDTSWLTESQNIERVKEAQRKEEKIFMKLPIDQRPSAILKMQEIAEQIKNLQSEFFKTTEIRNAILSQIPNIPLSDVQEGGEDDAVEISKSDVKIREASATPKNYTDLMGGRIDMERGSKVAGARFTYLSGDLARLELGIASYVMDMLTKQGFTQVVPPVLLNQQAMAGMGYLDQAGDEVYKTQDDLYLVGTSEQSLGAMHMDEILDIATFPLRYAAFTPCFRREAGSHGKDVKGILRLHQFDKVEMFSITTAEKSEEEHQFLLARQKEIMDSLKLPYRVIRLAAGDLGGPSAKTYDIETWIPSEQKYRETHSTSNTTDYQSRRLNIRYKTQDGTMQKVHMLNGTAVALSRLLIALIENHQQQDGSVQLPECLHPYLPFQNLAPAVP